MSNVDLTLIQDEYHTAIVFSSEEEALEFVNEVRLQRPERYNNSFTSSVVKTLFRNIGYNLAITLALDVYDLHRETLNWCDVKWFEERRCTIMSFSDLCHVDDFDVAEDLSTLFI